MAALTFAENGATSQRLWRAGVVSERR